MEWPANPGQVNRAEPVDLEPELAFEERVADSAELAFRVAFGVLRHREDAEDVAQEALFRACDRRGMLRDPHRFRAWLVRICWRHALNHRRAGQRRERRELAVASSAAAEPNAEQVVAAIEFRTRLHAAIEALPEKLRQVVVLAGIEQYDMGEVAALLELPEGTVKSRLHVARKRLMEALHEL
jgi:RNA polymerase sigma-70 factor (ECF subfamily)